MVRLRLPHSSHSQKKKKNGVSLSLLMWCSLGSAKKKKKKKLLGMWDEKANFNGNEACGAILSWRTVPTSTKVRKYLPMHKHLTMSHRCLRSFVSSMEYLPRAIALC